MKRIIKNNQRDLPKTEQQTLNKELSNTKIDGNLGKSMELLKSLYSFPFNMDVKIRTFQIGGINKQAFLFYISTIADTKMIEEGILSPLLKNQATIKDIADIIPIQTVEAAPFIEDVLPNINVGNTALFVEGIDQAYVLDTGHFKGRGIEKAENEIVIKGPKEAFNELALTNISLIRKKIRNENLVVESIPLSKRSKEEVFMVYVKDLVNDALLNNIKARINELNVDTIQSLAILEQYIEDRKISIFPTVLYTERPDRAAFFIADGYIVLIMDSSPSALILPTTFWSFFHTSEDHYLRFLGGNFIRFLRIFGLFITLFISAVYISITNYHIEMLPADLLLAVAATREIAPFPAIIEALLLEFSFELIREAGLRVPSPIGPTIGIVGALILGQAAVQANIVSPLVIVIIAIGGLSSYVIGDVNLNFAIRLLRFLFIFSAALFGFYGMTAVFSIGLFYMVKIKSFGIPYLAPFSPKYLSSKDTLFRKILKNEIFRPGYLKPKDMHKKR